MKITKNLLAFRFKQAFEALELSLQKKPSQLKLPKGMVGDA